VVVEAEDNFCIPCWKENNPGKPVVTASEEMAARSTAATTALRNKRDSARRKKDDRQPQKANGPNWNLLMLAAAVVVGLIVAGVLLSLSASKNSENDSKATTDRPEKATPEPVKISSEPEPRQTTPPPKKRTPPRIAPKQVDGHFIGNRNSFKLHNDQCRFGRSMSPHNRVPFTDAADALSQGYKWCRSCRP